MSLATLKGRFLNVTSSRVPSEEDSSDPLWCLGLNCPTIFSQNKRNGCFGKVTKLSSIFQVFMNCKRKPEEGFKPSPDRNRVNVRDACITVGSAGRIKVHQ